MRSYTVIGLCLHSNNEQYETCYLTVVAGTAGESVRMITKDNPLMIILCVVCGQPNIPVVFHVKKQQLLTDKPSDSEAQG